MYAYVCGSGRVGTLFEAMMDKVERAHPQETNPNPGGEEPEVLL